MKIGTLLTAGLVSLASLAPVGLAAPASAQRTVVHERTTVTRTGYGNRHHHRTRRVCSNRYRHGHRVRVCRTVRY